MLERPLTLLSPLREEHRANAVAAAYSRHPQTLPETSEEYLSPQVSGSRLALVDLQPSTTSLVGKEAAGPKAVTKTITVATCGQQWPTVANSGQQWPTVVTDRIAMNKQGQSK